MHIYIYFQEGFIYQKCNMEVQEDETFETSGVTSLILFEHPGLSARPREHQQTLNNQICYIFSNYFDEYTIIFNNDALYLYFFLYFI